MGKQILFSMEDLNNDELGIKQNRFRGQTDDFKEHLIQHG
jgi:hypothetical protein